MRDSRYIRLVLVGDHNQLPPSCANNWIKEQFSRSMLERLMHTPGMTVHVLELQYRMLEPIARWPAKHLYDQQLRTVRDYADPPAGFPWAVLPSNQTLPLAFVH